MKVILTEAAGRSAKGGLDAGKTISLFLDHQLSEGGAVWVQCREEGPSLAAGCNSQTG